MKFFTKKIDTAISIKRFRSAKPFSHLVVDNLLDDTMLRKLLSYYPSVKSNNWWVYDNPLEKKFALNSLDSLDPIFREFFDEVNSPAVVTQLANLADIPDLVPDPALRGGGLHQIVRGGKLDVHEDFNVHHDLKAFRKLNVIVYLNEDWDTSWGGDLQLWNADMTTCEKSVYPIFNRMVIFRTDMKSNHGHPDPLMCPEGMSRKSLAMYYYVPMTEDEWNNHVSTSTQFKRRPEDALDPEVEELRARRNKGRVADKTT